MGKRKFAPTNGSDGHGNDWSVVRKDNAERVKINFDRVIHERLRLGIISALAASEKLSFKELKTLLDTTDGNVSVHARKLEDAGYILCEKSFKDRTPLTEFRITEEGRSALTRYLDHMETLISAMKGAKR